MRKILTLTGLVIGLLAMLAVPASAHSSVLSGQTACGSGNHVVTWTIGNDFGLTMTIDTATATLGNQTFAVTGYTSPVDVSPATTTATTTIPGNLTGTVTLTVHSVWSDEFSQTNSTTVALTVPCNEETTTTTASTTTTLPTTTTVATTTTLPTTTTSIDVLPTTTLPVVTTTTGPAVTTTTAPLVPTTTTYICTVPPVTSLSTPPCNLPHTGSNSGPMFLGGLMVLGLGGALAGTAKRRNWI